MEEWETLVKRRNDRHRISDKNSIAPTRSYRPFWGRMGKIAASIALIAVLGFLLERYVINPVIVYQTPFGSQMSVVMPDSSVVKLNANSMMSFRTLHPRKVWLDGEAYFQVKKQPHTGANFLVITNDLTVEVLGTAFNVFEKEDKTEVILEEGSVKLRLKRDFESDILMKPGDLVAFSVLDKAEMEKRQVEPEIITSWKDGYLHFKNVFLSEVMKRIEAIYGWKTVFFNEELNNRKITIDLPSRDLENALIVLSKSMNIKIEKVENSNEKTLLLR